jgi:transposase
MRKDFDGLAALVQERPKKEVFSGHLFASPGEEGEHAGDPVLGRQRTPSVHQAHRRGGFVRSRIVEPRGDVMQPPMLIESIDCPEHIWRPSH